MILSQNKLIIFDLDGVIMDTPEMANAYFIEKYPTLTSEMMKEVLAGNFHEGLEKIKQNHISVIEEGEENTVRQKLYTAKKAKAPMYEGIKELLEELYNKGYILVINTSALEKNCLPLLQNNNILKFFDYVAPAEISKNKVEKFKLIEEKYNLPKENIIFITDTLGDVKEAKEAGVKTIAVTWGAHGREYFTRETNENLVAIVDTVEELKDFLTH